MYKIKLPKNIKLSAGTIIIWKQEDFEEKAIVAKDTDITMSGHTVKDYSIKAGFLAFTNIENQIWIRGFNSETGNFKDRASFISSKYITHVEDKTVAILYGTNK